ncbi:MAG TPA: chromate resistance protein ChrB domain-containing protein [Candidatus Polarisedimenticolaceae bacterium]|nr:chromate resistance protein ChrB domain-containing protein [Candidatus Polarisedimenticolaceae bacterium]
MPQPHRWLLLVHQIPSRPTRLRVRVWRQLQRLGAMAIKNSVYVLPASDKTREDFAWLQQEIESGGGEAVVFEAGPVGGLTDERMIEAFRRDRDAAYARVAATLGGLSKRLADGKARSSPPRLEQIEQEVDRMQAELHAIDEADFFAAPRRRQAAEELARCRTLLRSAERQRAAPAGPAARPTRDRASYQNRLWVTRPRPHIDRCASAWLIRRFIDRRPRFGFATETGVRRGGIPYDMPGAEFSHHGEDCTFETLMKQFALAGDAALRAIAEIVHDVDLKDGKFGRVEGAGVDAVLRGLAERVRDDGRLLRESVAVFDGLYATLAGMPVAAGRKRGTTKRGSRRRK